MVGCPVELQLASRTAIQTLHSERHNGWGMLQGRRGEKIRMDRDFFEQPILNSPYAYPLSHWQLDEQGQPTCQLVERRRSAEFITPIPKPKKQKVAPQQQRLFLDDTGLSTQQQEYDPTPLINEFRR